jgi:ion channel POLLUX/CASTOR
MSKFTLTDRMRYQFDNTMSRGTIALIGWLFLISTLVISVIALVAIIFGAAPGVGFSEMVWMGLMRTLDSGTMGGDQGSPLFLALMLTFTMAGIFLVSTLIGIVTSGIEAKIDQLRKGRSVVIERDHTVILGWSNQIFSIIGELAVANESRKQACVVVLANRDKVEMEDELASKVTGLGKTRVVCRTGNPADPKDLEIVNPNAARAVIILAPDEGNPDSQVIKTMLALINSPKRRPEPLHIVAEISDSRNLEVARMVGKDEVRLIATGETIARITVQVCRQAGLSVVYNDLFAFSGDEIYFKHEPSLVGKPFGDALFAYEDSAPIGLKRADGAVQLLPPLDSRIGERDELIVISEDDSTIKLSGNHSYAIDESALRIATEHPAEPEQTLILGWNGRGRTILTELDQYVAPGSKIHVVADDEELDEALAGIGSQLARTTVSFQLDDTTDRAVLDALDVPSYDHVIVLSYLEKLDAQQADAATLITLLHLRDIGEKLGERFSIVSEMLDIRNRELAEVTRADDFIVSDRLVSQVVAQVSENKDMAAVYDDLFDAEGCELYLKPACEYVVPGKQLSFYTLLEAARRRGEIAIGYRRVAEAGNPAKAYGVYLNPDKSASLRLDEGDKLIVLSAN